MPAFARGQLLLQVQNQTVWGSFPEQARQVLTDCVPAQVQLLQPGARKRSHEHVGPVVRNSAPAEVETPERTARFEGLSDGAAAPAEECVPANVHSPEAGALRKGVREGDDALLAEAVAADVQVGNVEGFSHSVREGKDIAVGEAV